mmetsp:Transcript_38709/g.84197  ORF Transcript_38709/g.84197 Transcript_38709/m.84197 type:complete len:413 (-) Transcript_38709:229-1467(-)
MSTDSGAELGGSSDTSELSSTYSSDVFSGDVSLTGASECERTGGEERPYQLAEDLLGFERLVVSSDFESESISSASTVQSDLDYAYSPGSDASGGSGESPTGPQQTAEFVAADEHRPAKNPRAFSVSIPTSWKISSAEIGGITLAHQNGAYSDGNKTSWLQQHSENLSAIREAKRRHKEETQEREPVWIEGNTSPSIFYDDLDRSSSPDPRPHWMVLSAETRKAIQSDRRKSQVFASARNSRLAESEAGDVHPGSLPREWRQQRETLRSLINVDRRAASARNGGRRDALDRLDPKDLRAAIHSRGSPRPDERTPAAARRAARYAAAGKVSLAGPPSDYSPVIPTVMIGLHAWGARCPQCGKQVERCTGGHARCVAVAARNGRDVFARRTFSDPTPQPARSRHPRQAARTQLR